MESIQKPFIYNHKISWAIDLCSAKKMGLKINQERTKFMLVIPPKRERKAPAVTPLKVGEYQFEQAESFTYLGTTVSTQNTVRKEIKSRIMAANRSYFVL
jgi:hypothetical protein